MIGLIITLIIGAFCGWLAGRLMGTDNQGCLINIVLGLLGSFVGGLVISLATNESFTSDGNIIGRVIVGTLGAVILIAVARALMGRK